MSGLVKAKKYDWKDSNMAKFGSDQDRQVKKESAEQEPAWQGVGEEVGLKVWRIKQFQVTAVDEEEYGTFFKGDSYIVLNTYQEDDSEELLYDVHFWIGKESTCDEYGTAAYKTVELDTFLDDKAVQHREVQDHESETFQSYFEKVITLDGGCDSGFRKVEATEYKERLLHIEQTKARKNPCVNEVFLSKSSLKPGDVYILDRGLKITQMNCDRSQPMERNFASEILSKLKSERPKAEVTVVDEVDGDRDWRECVEFLPDDEPEEQDEIDDDDIEEPVLMRISQSEESGGTDMEKVKTGDITVDDLDTNDVFLIHSKSECLVWIGNGASSDQRKNGLSYAHRYLQLCGKFSHRITVVSEAHKQCQMKVETALAA